MNKTIISNVLRQEREWFQTSDKLPEVNTPVLCRFVNPGMIIHETDTEIYPMEDMKISIWNGENWKVCHPFPMFDYSPLSDHENLREGVKVTHWSEATVKELTGWASRFCSYNNFSHLRLEVDEDHKKGVYRALLHASSVLDSLASSEELDEETKTLYRACSQIMSDLQCCMDQGGLLDGTQMTTGSKVGDYFKSFDELKDFLISGKIVDRKVNTADESE